MAQNSPSATTLTDRAIIRLSGEGVRDFLQGLVTSPWRKSRTPSPDRRMTARSVRVVALMPLS